MTCSKWIGLGASLVMTVCCGISSSFNVYAVKLKTSFQLNQSQVELVASFVVMGWSLKVVTAWVIRRFGYQPCYILILFLTASCSLLMSVATYYVPFYRENIWLVCIFQLLNAAGDSGGFQCVSAIAAEHFSKRHTGKVISFYMAASGLARIYYSLLYEFGFQQQETLGYFFLTVAISTGSVVLLCYFLHRPPINDNSDTDKSNLIRPGADEEFIRGPTIDGTDENETGHVDKKSLLRELFSSSYFYLMGGSFILHITATHTFMNNVTGIGTAVGATNPLNLVNVLSIGMVTSRLIFGALYDYLHSLRNRFILVFVQCIIFFCSMIICLFWLNESTVYFMVALASIACGAGYFLFLIMLVSEFGIPNYPMMNGILDVFYAPVVLLSHLGSGWTYEDAALHYQTKQLFCKECFYGTYVIVLSLTTAVLFLQMVNASICYFKLRR